MIKIVADKFIPFLRGVFEPYAQVVYKAGSEIHADDVRDADALIIRTRTRCDEKLLKDSKVRLISSATIGLDHIDMGYCDSRHIHVRNAAGCNAGGVMQYVFSALYGVAARKSLNITGLTIGVIGVGNVGKRVERMALRLGFKVLRCDPPRAEAEGPYNFVSLDELLEKSDIVTLHVPLTKETHMMADKDFFAKMKEGAFFINAARGELVDDAALMAAREKLGPVIIDTWNNEPDVNPELIDMVDIATPHIAGYSYQGKLNGTSMAVRAVAHFFSWRDLYDFYPVGDMENMKAVKLDLIGKSQGEIASVLQYSYPIFTDDFMFRINPGGFEELRSVYQYRKEVFVD